MTEKTGTLAPTVSDKQIRELFVRTMRDGGATMEYPNAAAFVGSMVGKSALEVGLICGMDLLLGGWKRYVDHV